LFGFGVKTIHHFSLSFTLFLKKVLFALHSPASQRLQTDGVSAVPSTGVGQTSLTYDLCPDLWLKLPGMIQKKFIVSLRLPKWLLFILLDMHPSLKQQNQSKLATANGLF
jgi:hypothetical protein